MSAIQEKKLFFQAVEITDLQQREKYLQAACRGDEALRERINALLSAASVVGTFLELNQVSSPESEERCRSQPDQDASVPLDFLEQTSNPKTLGRLAHYDVISVLGHGAFGIVLKGFDRRLHRQVAIKILSPQLATTSPPRKRFLREARSCAAIKHPNVVQLYDVSDQPTPYIAMEYLDGQTLQERIDDAGPLDIAEVINIAEQLAAGLEAAHRVGLIHRDIKPSNILVEDKGHLRAVLTDFGLARAVDDASLTQSGVLTGTPIYMSPEQTTGQKLDARTDLFSLGSLLYVMVTGRPPFRARNTVAVLQRVANSKARPIPEISPESPEWLNNLIERLHVKEPENRIQSASEVLKILKERNTTRKRTTKPKAKTRKIAQSQSQSTTKSTKQVWGWIGSTCALLLVTLLFWSRLHQHSLSNDPSDSENQQKQSSGQSVEEHSNKSTLSGIAKGRNSEVDNQSQSPRSAAIWVGWTQGTPPPAVTPFDRKQALQHQKAWAKHLNVPVEFTDRLGITYRLIPPGEFTMGTSDLGIQKRMHHVKHDEWWEANLLSEGPAHKVAISKPYYLATTELTQNQFESIMSYNPAYFQKGSEKWDFADNLDSLDFPMDGASWDEIQTFLNRLNFRTGYLSKRKSLRIYRLPTEAEWEFACRGGTQTDFWTGDDALHFLKHENAENQLGRTSKVGEYQSNPFGLFDISGNVHEYVQDLWDTRYQIARDGLISVDPTGPTETEWGSRVARGGDYWWWSYHSRSSYRIGIMPQERSGLTIGFRLALDVDSYPMASEWKSSESPVTGFSEIHAASKDELKEWLSSIRGRYLPSRINLRWGASDVLFDAIAISPEKSEGDWQVNFFKDDREAGQDFNRMRNTHDIFWKLLIPQTGLHPKGCPGLKIWRQTERNAATWNIGDGDLLTEVNTASSKGAFLMSIPYTESGNGRNSAYVQHHRPGIGNRNFTGLTLPEFKSQVTQHRQRNWRLHFFQLAAGTPKLQINCTFRENLDELDWELSFNLSQADYERELHRRKSNNWYPTTVGSYLDDNFVRYFACWEKMKVEHNSSGFGGKPRGGFGGER